MHTKITLLISDKEMARSKYIFPSIEYFLLIIINLILKIEFHKKKFYIVYPMPKMHRFNIKMFLTGSNSGVGKFDLPKKIAFSYK